MNFAPSQLPIHFGETLGNFLIGNFHVDGAILHVHNDLVAILHSSQRSKDGGFRSHVTDGQTVGTAGEAAIGDDGNLIEQIGAGQFLLEGEGGGTETTLRSKITDHDGMGRA